MSEDSNECEICYKEFSRDLYILKDGPSNSDMPTKCIHYFCCQCWRDIGIHNKIIRCPMCREDVSEWFYSHYYDDEYDDDDDDDYVEDDDE